MKTTILDIKTKFKAKHTNRHNKNLSRTKSQEKVTILQRYLLPSNISNKKLSWLLLHYNSLFGWTRKVVDAAPTIHT
ncbi:hypothetical protein HanRHA438_Chr09g0430021 [Helianthus annuus]|nr:hypothetical protein HanIR_Chr09g0450371 [Helianthus annuus]KAJ0891005.1 hypothetical protein HanRHA438_Chr09g0430021 [Helianthus annuus]